MGNSDLTSGIGLASILGTYSYKNSSDVPFDFDRLWPLSIEDERERRCSPMFEKVHSTRMKELDSLNETQKKTLKELLKYRFSFDECDTIPDLLEPLEKAITIGHFLNYLDSKNTISFNDLVPDFTKKFHPKLYSSFQKKIDVLSKNPQKMISVFNQYDAASIKFYSEVDLAKITNRDTLFRTMYLDLKKGNSVLSLDNLVGTAYSFLEGIVAYSAVAHNNPEYTITENTDSIFMNLIESGAFDKLRNPNLYAVCSGVSFIELSYFKSICDRLGFDSAASRKVLIDGSASALALSQFFWPENENLEFFVKQLDCSDSNYLIRDSDDAIYMKNNAVGGQSLDYTLKEMDNYNVNLLKQGSVFPFITVPTIDNETDYKFSENHFFNTILRELLLVDDTQMNYFKPYSKKVKTGSSGSFYWENGVEVSNAPDGKLELWRGYGDWKIDLPNQTKLIFFKSYRYCASDIDKLSKHTNLNYTCDTENGMAALFR